MVNSHNFLTDSWLKLTILVWHFWQDEGALLASLGLDGAEDGADDGVGDAGLGLEEFIFKSLPFFRISYLTLGLDRDRVDEAGHFVDGALLRGGVGHLVLLDLVDLEAGNLGQFGLKRGNVCFHDSENGRL